MKLNKMAFKRVIEGMINTYIQNSGQKNPVEGGYIGDMRFEVLLVVDVEISLL
jgi:hypothetical protein